MKSSTSYIVSGILIMFGLICCFINTAGSLVISGICIGIWISIFAMICYKESKENKEK